MRLSRITLLSQQWLLHSEQLRLWCTPGVSEPRNAALAQSYLNNIKVDEAVQNASDALQLLYFMGRAGYPAESKLGTNVQQLLRQMDEFDLHSNAVFIDLQENLTTLPRLIVYLNDYIFPLPRWQRELASRFEELDGKRTLAIFDTIWKAAMVEKLELNKEMSFIMFRAIEKHLTKGSVSVIDICQVTCWSWCDELTALLSTELQKLSGSASMHLLVTLSNTASLNEIAVETVLPKVAKTFTDLKEGESLQLLMSLCSTICPVTLEFLQCARSRVPSFRNTSLDDATRAIFSSPNPLNWSVLAAAIEAEVKNRLAALSKVPSAACDPEEWLPLVHCAALLSLSEAAPLLQQVSVEDSWSTDMLIKACEAMWLLSVYPPQLVDKAMTVADSPLCKRHGTWLMWAAVGGCRKPPAKLTRAVLLSKNNRQFRRRQSVVRELADSLSTCALVDLLTQTAVVKEEGLALAALSANYISPRDLSRLLERLLRREVPSLVVLRAVTERCVSVVDRLDVAGLLSLLRAAAHVGLRDVAVFDTVVRQLAPQVTTTNVALAIAEASDRLGFQRHFEEMGLLPQLFLSNVPMNSSTFMSFMSASSRSQRESIMCSPRGEAVLRDMDMSQCETVHLLLLFSTARDSVLRDRVGSALQNRKPLGKDEMKADEAIAAVEAAVPTMFFAPVVRIVSPCVRGVDEPLMMRLYQCALTEKRSTNSFFRMVGSCLLTSIQAISPDNALLWLCLYHERQIRDDGVGKALVRRAGFRESWPSKQHEARYIRAATFFGVKGNAIPTRKKRRPHTKVAFRKTQF